MSKTDIAIRAAVEADLPAILDLYAQAGLAGDRPMGLEAAKKKLRRFAEYPDYRLYVAADSGDVPIATYALLIMDNIAHGGRPLAIVEQVVVSGSNQGKGLGSAMMHHAMAEARAKGCYKLGLSSHSRFTRAHAFYDKLGFKRHGYSFEVDLL